MQRLKKVATKLLMVAWDFLASFLSVFLAFSIFEEYHMPVWIRTLMVLKTTLLIWLLNLVRGGYRRHFSEPDVIELASQTVCAMCTAAIQFVLEVIVLRHAMPTAIFISYSLLLIVLTVMGRLAAAFIVQLYQRQTARRAAEKAPSADRTVVYGAGAAGRYFYDRTLKGTYLQSVVAFMDDDADLHGVHIGTTKVVGGLDKLAQTLRDLRVGQVVVAIPTISGERLKEIHQICRENGVSIKRFAGLEDASNLHNAQMRPINIEDLLHRRRITLDPGAATDFVRDKTVMVTGGAGSIGSEICRQVLSMDCKHLVVFDINENGLFHLNNELIQKGFEGRFSLRLGSIRDRARVDEVMTEFSPQIVFHAAAHKHVPMMELNPIESIKNNVFGTINVCQNCLLHHVQKFILISTDKAVNPTNIMGASKRIAELAVQTFDRNSAETEFSAVRFGNVLGSEGSVVPYFLKQIAAGGPVTVTHPDMRRYFMTIPEAVQLVLEAGALAKGGEIFVLDMGEPVLIRDLACDLIRLSGYEPDRDIKITFTGLRPGEKLFEELNMTQEEVDHTPNQKIFIMKPIEQDQELIAAQIKDLQEHLNNENLHELLQGVKNLVPTFKHEL